MRAAFLKDSLLKFESGVSEPIAQQGEILVDILLAGICETDLQLCNGYMNFSGIIGHEFVGIARSGRFEGQRVVGEINCVCQQCRWCVEGAATHCPHRTVLGILNRDGAFADTISIPEVNLHPVPDSVSDEHAVLTEPLAAALQILQQIDLTNKKVAVLGDGRLGMLCAQAIRLKTDSILVVGKHCKKMDRFNQLNIQTCLLNDLKREPAFDVVIDCTGSPSGLEVASAVVVPLGTVVLKTTVARNHTLSLAELVINEITVIGSRCGPFKKALELLDSQCFNLDGLITHRFSIEDVSKAMQAAVDPDAFKVVFDLSR